MNDIDKIKKISIVYDCLYDLSNLGRDKDMEYLKDKLEVIMTNRGFETKLNDKTQKIKFVKIKGE